MLYAYKYAILNNFIHQVHFLSFIPKQNADFCNHWLQEVKKDVFYSISILLDFSAVFCCHRKCLLLFNLLNTAVIICGAERLLYC